MKKLILIACIISAFCSNIDSQIRFDIKLGFSPGSNPATAFTLINRDKPYEEFSFNMVNTKPQYYGGVLAHVELGQPFFVEGGVAYTKSTSTYQINYRIVSEQTPAEQFMTESEATILLPVNFGVSMGAIDITSGLSAMKAVSQSHELSHLKGFSQDENSIRMGWQMGVRYAFHRAMIGVEYQGTMNRVCEGMYVNNHSLELMNVPGKVVFNVQYRF
ncbi:MAG TPA: hypothetical protein VMZ69_01465 [Saprospiraceae bacterium]|nr:hypothetical protein [Saprospiraceae bacterium]